MTVYAHSGSAVETYLAVDCTNASTSITLNDATGWPSPTGGQVAFGTIKPGQSGESKFLYTSRSGNVLSGVTWNADGTTSSASYTAGPSTKIHHGFSAAEADQVQTHINGTSAVHAASAVSYSGYDGTGTADDNAATDVETALDNLASAKLSKAGGTMTGALVLSGAPSADLHPATKKYVDDVSNSRWIPASSFGAVGGSPSLAGILATGYGWLLDASSIEQVACHPDFLPSDWSIIDVEVWWTNAGAGSGDVRWKAYWNTNGPGSSALSSTSASATATAGAQNIWVETVVLNDLAITGGRPLFLLVERTANDGADTLGNDCVFYGILIRKVS